jgi:hypothetical protein
MEQRLTASNTYKRLFREDINSRDTAVTQKEKEIIAYESTQGALGLCRMDFEDVLYA